LDVTAGKLAVMCLILLLGGLVQGSVGFGSGLVSVGLLAPVFGVKEGSVIFCLPAFCTTAAMCFRLRQHFRWQRVAPVLVGVAAGVPLGVQFLVRAQPRVLEVLLGALMLAAVAHGLIPHFARRRWHPLWVGVPCGLFGGAAAGALSTGGPPIVAYMSTQRFDRLRFAASLQVMFVFSTGIRLALLFRAGLLDRPKLTYSLAGVPAILIGAAVGLGVLHRMPERIFRTVVAGLLLVLGVHYLLP
jgi:uncharacterized membrane protein YfcA